MKINNYLLNEILHLNDVTLIDCILYVFNDFQRTADNQVFNSIFFLKTVAKATTNSAYINDKFQSGLRDFMNTLKISGTETMFNLKPKYIDLFSDANLRKGYTDIDVSIVYNLHSLHSKKMYMYLEIKKFQLKSGQFIDIFISDFKTNLNIVGYDNSGHFIQLVDRFFSDIKKIIPSYEFKISYKKQSRKIISLLCFFNEKPEVKIEDFEVKTEFIPEAKEPETFQETFIPTVKIEPQQTKIENMVNYQPEIKKEIINQVINDNNDKELIEMDNEDIDKRFADIENLISMKNIVNDSEVKENIKMSVPKEVVKEIPKIEIKEEIKQDENLSVSQKIFNALIKNYRGFEHRFENMKVSFDNTNKKAIINFKDEPFNNEWAVMNHVDKQYQKAFALITSEIYNVEIFGQEKIKEEKDKKQIKRNF